MVDFAPLPFIYRLGFFFLNFLQALPHPAPIADVYLHHEGTLFYDMVGSTLTPTPKTFRPL